MTTLPADPQDLGSAPVAQIEAAPQMRRSYGPALTSATPLPPLPSSTSHPTPAPASATAPQVFAAPPATRRWYMPAPADPRVRAAVTAALAQLGLPYVWGGDGPTQGETGFDCSGLTTFAYRAAAISLPRTAHTQYLAGPRIPPETALLPGDLVFYGTPDRVHHVGLYLGADYMINAPTFGQPVQIAHHRWPGDDYLGATRPAAVLP